MEQPTIVFEPYSFWATLTTIIFLLLAIILAVYLFFYNKKQLSYQARKRKGMVNMLLFTAILLIISGAFLNWWNSRSLTSITISKDKIDLPLGNIGYDQIRRIYIYVNRPMTITNPPPDSLMNYERSLIIEEVGKKQPHIFSEEDYPIDSIYRAIKERSLEKK